MELMKKHVDLDSLETLYEMMFEEAALHREFDVRGGSWTLEDGTLVGRNCENCPGMIISRQDFFGPVMLDFEARTIPPCTHDINCMWSGSWDYETNTRALAYVVGLEGWWDGKVGFEKSPEYKAELRHTAAELRTGPVLSCAVRLDRRTYLLCD